LGRAQKAHVDKTLLPQLCFESRPTAEEVARGEVIDEDNSALVPVLDRPRGDDHAVLAQPRDRSRDAVRVAQIAET
jgi:hypothetical protein